MTDASGAVVARHDYFAFGEDAAPLGGQPLRFTGKELDAETALMYFGARYYRTVTGRFTSVDPVMDLQKAVAEPQLWNRYAYVTNNPQRYVDPDGRQRIAARFDHHLAVAANVRDRVADWLGRGDPDQSPAGAAAELLADLILGSFLPRTQTELESAMAASLGGPLGILQNAAKGRAG